MLSKSLDITLGRSIIYRKGLFPPTDAKTFEIAPRKWSRRDRAATLRFIQIPRFHALDNFHPAVSIFMLLSQTPTCQRLGLHQKEDKRCCD